MNPQIYQEGPISYRFNLGLRGKWTFSWQSENKQNTYISKAKGREGAAKIARIIGGSLKRSGQLDNLARKNIGNLT